MSLENQVFAADGEDARSVLASYQDREFAALVRRAADGTHRLWWTDYVVNEWSETLPTLRLARMRLAHLIEAVAGREDQMMDPLDEWLPAHLTAYIAKLYIRSSDPGLTDADVAAFISGQDTSAGRHDSIRPSDVVMVDLAEVNPADLTDIIDNLAGGK